MINNFGDFCAALLDCGFSMGGGNDKGIFALIPYDWQSPENEKNPVKWHTGDRETDPWEWRMRVLEERRDMAYSKVFFRTSGYITKEWYPYFYAVRRRGESFAEAYESGKLSHGSKEIYSIVSGGPMALHEIKALGGFHKENNAAFEKGLLELQMGLFITISGRAQKMNKKGEAYGWNSTVFTTVEDFWRQRGFALSQLDPGESYEKIKAQALKLNPQAEPKKIDRFIRG